MTHLKKVLIIRFSSIGDIVLTSPVIRCIKKQLPDVMVHYLTKSSFAGILKSNPHVDKVYELGEDLDGVIKLLKEENYDFVVDLHHNLRSFRVKSALKKPSEAFDKLNIEKWLLVNLKIDRMPSAHIVERYMETTDSLNVHYDGGGLDFFIPNADVVDPNTLPSPWNKGYIAMVIGAKHFTKKMPDAKLISLILEMKLPVVLIGGKEDVNSGKHISENTKEFSFDSTGKYNLFQSASLVENARLVITHDTGLMHIAAAKHQKIISLWGNTVPEFGMFPFLPAGSGESAIFENNTLNCRPCSKIGYDKCPRGHFKCMNDLDISKIAAVAKGWWGKG